MSRVPTEQDNERWNPTNGGIPVPEVARADRRTEMAAGRRFAEMHGENVRYVAPWRKWLVWDGMRWRVDDVCAVDALAKKTAESIWSDIVDELTMCERAEVSALVSYGRGIASANGIAHLLSLAQSEPGIAITPQQLDSHPWLLNCTNGIVNLKTGERLPHDRGLYLTKLCPHEYIQGAEAECPIWESAIETVFGSQFDLIRFVHRLFGSALTGEVIEHILPILWGAGSNGKSLIVETLLETLGEDYACKGADDLLLASQNDRHPTEKADLFGRRLVICNETEDGKRLAEATVKALTGGDTVSARRMREDFWRFQPSHSLFLVTNHKPLVRGSDHGIWRRIRLVPFAQRFWDEAKGETGPAELKADLRLKERLRPELPGILYWLVQGCLEWQRHGLGQPSQVTDATAGYRDAMDVLGAFIEECCVVGEGFTVKASELRKRYDDWCKQNGEYPMSGRRFGESLTERGIKRKSSNGTWYRGICLQ